MSERGKRLSSYPIAHVLSLPDCASMILNIIVDMDNHSVTLAVTMLIYL